MWQVLIPDTHIPETENSLVKHFAFPKDIWGLWLQHLGLLLPEHLRLLLPEKLKCYINDSRLNDECLF